MQRAKKIFIYLILLLTTLVFIASVSVQSPLIQRIIIERIATSIASDYGIDVEIDHVLLKPFKGSLSIQGININESNSILKCDELEISGWELLKNWGLMKKSKIKGLELSINSRDDIDRILDESEEKDSGLIVSNSSFQVDEFEIEDISWNIFGEYVGNADYLKLEGIKLNKENVEIDKLQLTNGSSNSTQDSIYSLQSLICSVNYDDQLRLDIEEFHSDSLEITGVFRYDKNPEFDLLFETYPNYLSSEIPVELGKVTGQLQFKDSVFYFQNTHSTEGHFIQSGLVKSNMSYWELIGQTEYKGQVIRLNSIGDLTSSNGLIELSDIGKVEYRIDTDSLGFYSTISSDLVRYNGSQLRNMSAYINLDKNLNDCSISLSSNEIETDFSLSLNHLKSKKILSEGSATIKDGSLINSMLDHDILFSDNSQLNWKATEHAFDVFASIDFINYSTVTFKKVGFEGDVMNYNGSASCNEVLMLYEGRSEKFGSDINTYFSNKENLSVYTTWKSSKGLDGELAMSGELGEEIDLGFSMITKPITTDQTIGWIGIPIETEAIEIEGKINGTLFDPIIDLRTHSENIKIQGENISDCILNIKHQKGVNRVTSELNGLGDLNEGLISIMGVFDSKKLDLTTSINELPLSYVNPFLEKSTVAIEGELNGVFSIDGSIATPIITGNGEIDSCTVSVGYMGTNYNVSGGFHVEPDALELNGLNVDDGKGGSGILVGTLLHDNYKDWNLDVSLSIEDNPIEIMNIPYSPTRYFYGPGKGFGDINVFGYDDNIVIEANITTSEETEFVLPMDVVESGNWSSFIEITNPQIQDDQELNIDDNPTKVSLDLNIEVMPSSNARIVFNSDLGDEINGRCKGHLHLDLHDLERLEIFGDLEIVEGEYSFNLKNIISKNFKAVPGGTINWFGDPYDAHIDLSTLYETRASLRPILPEITDASKYDIELGLNLDGELMRPDILFDIKVPEASAQHQASISSVLSNEEELNRQSVSLLVINSFLPSTWIASAVGSTGIQESSAELITAQLGHWLSGISDDVNVGIDYDSPSNTGDEAAIAVALSTQLFNDRLHIEGEVGTQNLYAGTTDDLQIQDVKIKYDIKEDGTIQLTGYSTQKATVPGLEGESVQGIGFLFNKDFERIRDLFKRKSKKE